MKPVVVTAHHEAGHAIAVLIRGGTVDAITLRPGLTRYHLPEPVNTDPHNRWRFENGQIVQRPTQRRLNPPDDPLVAFGGPWATARLFWPLPTLESADVQGRSFADYLTWASQRSPHDYAAFKHADTADLLPVMENNWPTVRKLARWLVKNRGLNHPLALPA